MLVNTNINYNTIKYYLYPKNFEYCKFIASRALGQKQYKIKTIAHV